MSDETKNDAFDGAAAEEARVKAEARRRRILEKSRDRMGLVSGEPVKLVDDNAASDTTSTATTTEEEIPSSESSANPSGSSRMQAMRRRRFAAKKQKDSETTETTASENAASMVDDNAATAAADTAPSKESVTVAEEESAPPSAKDSAPTTTTTKTTSVGGTKKKYKGVAAMSRQRIKERNAQESKDRTEDIAKHAPKVAPKVAVAKLPVIMHIITVLVLFGAGLKIGMDQVVHDHVVVHRELLAPQQHGVGVIHLFQRKTKTGTKSSKDLLQDQMDYASEKDMQDEFATKEPIEEEYEPNIDPLFQLDLDLYTRGDSFIMYPARLAVAMHRVNLFIFYYTPIRIVTTLTHIPRKLMESPPYLFLFALVLRQFAKRVLGAGLPEEPPEQKSQDILAMIKNYVMGFLASSFPTVVELYDAFMHVRSDMFIILCGLFVGLAWNHHHQIVGTSGTSTSSSEQHDEL